MKDAMLVQSLARRARLDTWFAAHHGVVTLQHLLRLGCSRTTVYRMVERGELVVLLPGVFKGSQWPTGREQLMAAACMRNVSAVIGHLTAAELWGFRKITKDPHIHVLVPHGCTADLDGYITHQSRRIDPVDIVQRADGIRVVSPARAALDIADVVRDAVTASVLEQLINDNRGTMATHVATLSRLGHPRHPGTATMGRVIRGRPRWRKAMQSDLEVKVLAEIQRQGLPLPELQHPLVLPTGDRIRVDFAWPAFKEVLEVDHPFWHAGADESHHDKRRDRKLGTVGWHTTRVTDFDVERGLGDAIADVAEILRLSTRPA